MWPYVLLFNGDLSLCPDPIAGQQVSFSNSSGFNDLHDALPLHSLLRVAGQLSSQLLDGSLALPHQMLGLVVGSHLQPEESNNKQEKTKKEKSEPLGIETGVSVPPKQPRVM